MKLASALFKDFYPFDKMELFNDYKIVEFPEELEKGDALVIWGGGDISPSLYNREVGQWTGADYSLSSRDMYEWNLLQGALALDIPIIGICRGAQMLCAAAGGYLIQDITGHGMSHPAQTVDGEIFIVSSLHHQMMVPASAPHELIAWSKRKLSQHYLDVDTPVEMDIEPEFIYFPKQKGMAIQWHPEYMDVDCPANRYVRKQIERLVLK